MYTTRRRLLGAFLGIIGALFAVSLAFLALSIYITDQYRTVTDTMIAEYQLVDTMATLIDSYNKRVQSGGTHAADTEARRVTEAEARAKDLIAQIGSKSLDLQSQSDFIGFKASVQKFSTHIDESLSRFQQDNIKNYFDDFNEANKQYGFVQQNGTQLLYSELKYASGVSDQIERTYILSMIFGALALIALVIGCIVFVMRFSARFVAPLSALSAFAEKVAAGDLTAHAVVAPDSSVEISSLSRSLELMVARLVKNLQEISNTAETLSKGNQELDRINKLMVDRELKMIELKAENKRLKGEKGVL